MNCHENKNSRRAVIYVRNQAVFAIFLSLFCSLKRSCGRHTMSIPRAQPAQTREKEVAYQVLFSRSFPFLPVRSVLVLLILPLCDLLLPLLHIKVHGTHALHALVLGQVRRVPSVGPRECARMRVEPRGEVVCAARRRRWPCEGRIEVGEGGVDALRRGGLLQGVNLRDRGGYGCRTGGRRRRRGVLLLGI